MNHASSILQVIESINKNSNKNVQIEVFMHYFVYIYWISFTVEEPYVYVYKVRGTICRKKLNIMLCIILNLIDLRNTISNQ